MLRRVSVRPVVGVLVLVLLVVYYRSKMYPSTIPLALIALLSTTISTTAANQDLTAFIPWVPGSLATDALPWTSSVRVPFCLDHQDYCYTVTLDTGSTGMILSAADLENYDKSKASAFPVGWHFLTSSKVLYIGNWIPRNLTFPTGTSPLLDKGYASIDSIGTSITAEIPILAVTRSVICPGYNSTTGGPDCPPSAEPTRDRDMPEHITYMGVGFGRQYNGQPQGNPDKNPFLNIIAINGTPISSSQMHAGYVITDKGIDVGLTTKNSEAFGMVKLERQRGDQGDKRDWAQTPACLAVSEKKKSPDCVAGTVLVDTGISQMYLTIPSSIPVNRTQEKSASSGKLVSVLGDGQTVSVRIGGGTSKIDEDDGFTYSFLVGDKTDALVPPQVITTVSDVKKPFVNTGRYFLRTHDVLFDAENGFYGIRSKELGAKTAET